MKAHKVLSIRQPWATAIVLGYKPVENRNWPTKHRGEFLVHASLKFDQDGLRFIQKHFGLFEGMTKKDFSLGGIIGKTNLVDCVTEMDNPWFFGKYGFVLENSKELEFIQLKGTLNFFEYEGEINDCIFY